MDRIENVKSPDEKKFQLISELLTLSRENPSTAASHPQSLDSCRLNQRRAYEIDQLTTQLKRERIAILRQLNRHQSPVYRLPLETLADILAYAVPDFDLHPFDDENERRLPPTKLAAVSTHFREVASATPRLWTSIRLGELFWLSSSGDLVLALYFKNVQRMGLNIEVDGLALDRTSRGIGELLESFNFIFKTNLSKVRALRFMPLPRTWSRQISAIQETRFFPNLKYCCIVYASHSDHGNTLEMHGAPSLEKVTIVGGSSSRVFPWAQIKHLELLSTDSTTCLNILTQCPNLVSLQLKSPQRTFSAPAFASLLTSEITFKHLRTLCLKSVMYHDPGNWVSALCQHLCFPAVQQFTWRGFSKQEEESLGLILPRLPKLRAFHLYWPSGVHTFQQIEELFSGCANVSDMTISFKDMHAFRPDLFSVLTVNVNERVYLPLLDKLTLRIFHDQTKYMLSAEHDLLDMLRSRQMAGMAKLGHFKIVLRIQNGHTIDYYKGLLRRVGELGVQVGLVMDKKHLTDRMSLSPYSLSSELDFI